MSLPGRGSESPTHGSPCLSHHMDRWCVDSVEAPTALGLKGLCGAKPADSGC